MKTENAVFGLRIRSIRERQKLSREKLAELANISTQFLADIETGKKGMTVITLKKLCDALHISSDLIIYDSDDFDASYINSLIEKIPPEKIDEFHQILCILINLMK